MPIHLRTLICILACAPVLGAASVDVAPGRTERTTLALPQKATLVIENPVGAVEIFESDGEELEIDAVNVGPTPVGVRTRWSASNILRVLTRSHLPLRPRLIEVGAGAVDLPPEETANPGRMNLILRVPRHRLADLDVATNHGKIVVRGYFADDEQARSRRISLRGCRDGAITCAGVTGRLSVRAVGEVVRLEKVIGDVYAASTGEIHVSDGVGNFEFDGGLIIAVRNRGDLQARTMASAIEIEDHSEGRATALSQTGRIRMDSPNAVEEARSLFGEVVKSRFKLIQPRAPGPPASEMCLHALIAELGARAY